MRPCTWHYIHLQSTAMTDLLNPGYSRKLTSLQLSFCSALYSSKKRYLERNKWIPCFPKYHCHYDPKKACMKTSFLKLEKLHSYIKLKKNWERVAKEKLCRGKSSLGANLGVPGWVLPLLSPVQSLTAQQQCLDQRTNHTDSEDNPLPRSGKRKSHSKSIWAASHTIQDHNIFKKELKQELACLPLSVLETWPQKDLSPQ